MKFTSYRMVAVSVVRERPAKKITHRMGGNVYKGINNQNLQRTPTRNKQQNPKQPDQKTGTGLEETFLQTYTDGQ
jgi:hypothetical protein